MSNWYRAKVKPRREEAMARGLCGQCMKRPMLPGFKSCAECRSRAKERHEMLKQLHKCSKCEEPLPEGYAFRDCEKCMTLARDRRRAARDKLMAEGRCVRCRQPKPDDGYATCRACRVVGNDYHEDRKAKGLCQFCKNKAMPGKTYCFDCAVRISEKKRLANAGKDI